MYLNQKIIQLEALLEKCNNYNLNELNEVLRENYLGTLEETLKRSPYLTEKDKKKIVADAKRLTLTENEWLYLQKKCKNLLFCQDEKIIKKTKSTLHTAFEKIKNKLDKQYKEIKIQFLHEFEPDDWYLVIYDSTNKEEFQEDLGYFKLDLNYKKIWGFQSTEKYDYLSDKMFGTWISIDDNHSQFMDIFHNLLRLKSYEIIQNILQTEEFKTKINGFNCSFLFEIGENECKTFLMEMK